MDPADSTADDVPVAGRPRSRDDWAYILPMAAFLLFTAVAGHWKELYPICYVAKTIVVAILLVLLWRHYTPISWNYWWLGLLVGVIGVVQWVGMEKILLHVWPNYPPYSHDAVNPAEGIASPLWRMVFIAFRVAGPVLVVPFMEELFWRDFLWRTTLSPNDFKMVKIGDWDRQAFWTVAIVFASVHIQWMTAIVWAAMIAALLIRTKSLGACIIAHAVTNLLLGLYVLRFHDWWFW